MTAATSPQLGPPFETLALPTTAYIGLGANLGDQPAQTLHAAVAALDAWPGLRVLAVSRLRLTAPVGGPPGQPDYINAVAACQTARPAEEVLAALLAIEARLGRVRDPHTPRWGPRVIDLDLLTFGPAVIHNPPELVVPHPRLAERLFVVEPLAEIAPNLVHPICGRTMTELLAALRAAPQGPSGGLPPPRLTPWGHY